MIITEHHKIDEYYDALLKRRSDYVGIFYVGVKSTSVFCIATCRARKPKKENVEFFTDFKSALHHGYRPCKVCRPTENSEAAPEEVEWAISMVRDHPKEKINDQKLRDQGISPSVVRRWFKQHYGMTFHAFQRMYRINVAFTELKGGKRTTSAAFDAGYDSLSGFGYTFKKVVGKAPKNSAESRLILMKRLTTPLGPMFICATEKGICLLEFVDRKMLETEFRDLQQKFKAPIVFGENKIIKQAIEEIRQYFSGERTDFEVSLDTPGTLFQQQVWQKLQQVNYGTTSTYQGLATVMGNTAAIRAVARANGSNRISIIIPCHRIIGKGGSLVGYGGGLKRKQWLIDHERKILEQL